MECHSTPDVAPAAMVKKYGADNGFGWNLDQVIAAQIVSVPMSVPISVADQAFRRLIFFLIATFVVTIIALDSALYWLVIRPLHKVSAAADRISKGETDLPELDVRGRDEIADVTASFNRMHVSLAKALKMLDRLRSAFSTQHSVTGNANVADNSELRRFRFLLAMNRERSFSESISAATAL